MIKRLIAPVIALLLLAGLAFGWYWTNNNLLAVVDKQFLLVPRQEQVIGEDDSFFDSNILLSVEREGSKITRLVYASVNPDVEVLLTTTQGSPFSRSTAWMLQGTGSQTITAVDLPEQAVLAVYKQGGSRPEPLYLIRLK